MKLSGVKITNRKDCCGSRLSDVEVRAGNTALQSNFTGKITANKICGKFEGPGRNGENYTIDCEEEIMAEYVTIQIIDDNALLNISEIQIQTGYNGKEH